MKSIIKIGSQETKEAWAKCKKPVWRIMKDLQVSHIE